MTTNVPQPTFGATGFIIPSAQEVLAGVIADFQQAFGGNLNLSADDLASLSTPQGQLASSMAAIIYDTYELFLYYTTQTDPAYAQGRMQDAIARIYFLERNPSEPTIVIAQCTGLVGTVIPVNAIAQADDGSLYLCTDGGTIPDAGTIDLQFQAQIPGPNPCPANSLKTIYQQVAGWDTINNADDGVIGSDAESRQAFEARRAASVALNSIGSLPAVVGAVLAVDGVLEAYVTENDSNGPLAIGGYTLAPNSLFVAAVGGSDEAVAEAIWRKKAPGCAYNGNTVVTIIDQSPAYDPPFPSYEVAFERPESLPILFSVTIVNSTLVPANADILIQNAIIAAFTGDDGGPRAKIGSTLLASRYYAPIAALGSWAQIISILVGSANAPQAIFTAAIAATTLTVASIASGVLTVGQTIAGNNVAASTRISAQLSGPTGGVGTYSLSISQTVGSTLMTAESAIQNSVQIDIDQVPTISAADIQVILA